VIRRTGLGHNFAERVSAAILATRHDKEVRDSDAQLMVDVDLAILGTSPEIFWAYEENIRREYAWVPQHLFVQNRAEILRGFLRRPHIYYHRRYRERLEQNARLNLQQAIAKLSQAGDVPVEKI
jgi:predicted metal-dependent HD superfamily phosphohydrolase